MRYFKALNVSDLAQGEMTKVTVEGEPILLVNLEGTFYAVTNTCTHMGGSLVEGMLEGDVIKCPRHGAGFDVKTGRNVIKPTIFFIPGKTSDLKTYETKVENNEVLIGIDQ